MAWPRLVRLLAVVGLVLTLYFLVPVDGGRAAGLTVRICAGVVVLGALSVAVTAQLRLSAADGDRRIDGLVASIAAVLAVFALAFYALDAHDPHQVEGLRTRVDSLYFAASTMLTVGYGDVHATGQTARVVVLVQMVFDVVFVAAAAALLSSRVRSAASHRSGRLLGGAGDAAEPDV